MQLDKLSFATFNLFNLNQPGRALYGAAGWTVEQHERKLDWVARNLTILRSDVFAFQELWHRDSLAAALQRAGLADDYDLLVPPNGAQGGAIVCAAIVAKGLLVGTPEWIVQFPPKFKLHSSGDDPQTPEIAVAINGFSRPVLHFTIAPRDDEPAIHVYVCHFKSKAPTQVFREAWFKDDKAGYGPHVVALGATLSTIRRSAEAAALRMLLTERMQGNTTPVVVLGDFNDSQHSNTANILTAQPNYLVGDAIGGSDTALYTAQTLQEFRDTRDVYYTYVHQGMRESLDHIMVSEQFYDHSRKRRWLLEGMTVNNDHLNFDRHESDGTNDHGIIRASFNFKPMKA